jgi:hypothetical protein
MTPKEKAEELLEKFKFETKRSEIINDILLGDISVIFKHHKAKQCALIAVDGMYDIASENNNVQQMNYLVDIKQEIEKL